MNDDQLERLLRARPVSDTPYQPVIAELLDAPRDGQPVVGSLRWRHGGPAIARPVALVLLAAAILLAAAVMLVGGRPTDMLVVVEEPSPSPTTVSAGAVPIFPAADVTALLERFKTTRWADASKVVIDVAIVEDERIWLAASGPSWFTTQTGGYYPGQTSVRIGGLSHFVLLLITLRLVDEGLIDLDAPISRYGLSWPGGDGIKVRHLLDGSSGVPSFGDPLDDLVRVVAAEPSRTWTAADALRLAGAKPSRFEPGTKHAAVDTEDALLVSIIESVTGSGVWGALMGLSQEVRPSPLDVWPPAEVVPYLPYPINVGLWDPTGSGRLVEVADLPVDVRAVLGSRDWAMPVSKLAQGTHYLHRHPSLLSDQARSMMDRPFQDGGFGGLRMCPCSGDTKNGLGLVGHMGPYTALAVYVPSERLTIAIVANVAIDDGDLTGLLNEIHDLVVPAIR